MSLSVVLGGLMAFGVSTVSADSTYIGVKLKADWDTASTRCESFGGQLATFSSDADYIDIYTIRRSLGYFAWIGMHDQNTEGQWEFVDGDTSYCSPSTATGVDCDDIDQWYSGYPDGSGDCGMIWHWLQLTDWDCSSEWYHICEFDSDELAMASSNNIYIGRKELATWDTASTRCEDFGGQLATFGDDADYAAISSIRDSLGYNAWIGMNDLNDESQWQFVDDDTSYCSPSTATGEDCDDIDEWNSGEPNNSGDEDCAEIYGNGYLNDNQCSNSRYYICEFSSSTIKTAQVPFAPTVPGYRYFEFGAYSMTDVMVAVLAVFCVFNLLLLAVVCLRAKGAAKVDYAKVVADTDYEDQPLAI